MFYAFKENKQSKWLVRSRGLVFIVVAELWEGIQSGGIVLCGEASDAPQVS